MTQRKTFGKVLGIALVFLMMASMFGALPSTVSAASEKTTVSVTDASPWFTKGSNSGHPEYWKTYTHSGHTYIYTYVGGMPGNPSQPDCWAEFRPYLSQAGEYEVYAYFYADPTQSTQVPYTIYHQGGSTTVRVNQYSSSWWTWREVKLGTWNFLSGANTYVRVTDATGEPYNQYTTLNVDTIKFISILQPPDPPTLISPGLSSGPGPQISTLTPRFQWSSVPNVDRYALRISEDPYGPTHIIYTNENILGSSTYLDLPSGYLENGKKYRWDMNSHNSAGWGNLSTDLYFQTPPLEPPPPVPTIAYSPSSLSFEATEGGSNPTSQTLSIWNSGGGTLSWSVSDNAAWLTLSSTSGTSTGETDNVVGSVNISGLSSGSYSATITISVSGATNSPQTVSVALVIASAPPEEETVSTPDTPSGTTTGTTSTSYTYSTGGASSNLGHSLEYRFDWGDGSYSSWSSSTTASHSWSAQGTYTVRAQARCATHTDVLSSWSSGLSVSIIPPTGTINVSSTPSGASFNLSGPANYSGTTPWSKTNAPVGTYTITWGSMTGYQTPPSESKTLTQGGTISFYGLYHPQVPNGKVSGIDVSINQEDIDWPTVYDSGVRFAFVKATAGDHRPPQYIDDNFETNMNEGHNAGILVGAYHYAYPQYNDPVDEALFFISIASEYLESGYLRPALDVEEVWEDLTKEYLSNWVHQWMNTVKSETGIEPVLYTYSDYANNYLNSSITQYDLWIAHWTHNPDTQPDTAIWDDWDFWQYSDNGSVQGISRPALLDIFNGDMSRLNTFIITGDQPPVASFTVKVDSHEITPGSTVRSGDVVSFDASDSQGAIVSYEWDFGDGETATGGYTTHRFRGHPDGLRTYHVTLTVDDGAATDTDTKHILVEPLEKTVKVEQKFGDVLLGVADINVLYNWVTTSNSEDVYIVSRMSTHSVGIIGAYQGLIARGNVHSPTIIWRDVIFTSGANWYVYTSPFTPTVKDKEYFEQWGVSPPITKLSFPEDALEPIEVFEGIEVHNDDVLNLFVTGMTTKDLLLTGILKTLFYYIDTDSTAFHPDASNEPASPILMKALDFAIEILQLLSPGELRVYDSQGRVTGLVNGEVREEIPYSFSFDNTVVILSPSDSYRHQVAGTEEGSYGLGLASVKEGEATTFGRTDTPIVPGVTHQYTIDWDALSQGEGGVTVEIDSDGDGVFEQPSIIQPPIAWFTYSPENPVTGEDITFDASESYDPDGEVVSYEWYFGDGNTSSGKVVTHTYSTVGDYRVTLIVTDNDGALSTYSRVVVVEGGVILAYYRGLGEDPNVVELADLVQAANDWLNGVIPPGFTAVITLSQLVQLANEWLGVTLSVDTSGMSASK